VLFATTLNRVFIQNNGVNMLTDKEEKWVKEHAGKKDGLQITVCCPNCREPMIDPHEAPAVKAIAGTILWLECVHCQKQIEVELQFTIWQVGGSEWVKL